MTSFVLGLFLGLLMGVLGVLVVYLLKVLPKETAIAKLETEKQAFFENHEKREKELKDKLHYWWQELLTKNSNTLKEQSEESLLKTISPFKDSLKEFDKKFSDLHKERGKEVYSLKHEIEKTQEAHHKMSQEAQKLEQTLKGSSKSQGAWGEMVLEKLLSSSGLREGQEFVTQKTLKSDEGEGLKPDVIVNLPENRRVVIDSKVSLTAYMNYTDATTEEEKKQHQKSLEKSISQHLKSLSSKNYKDLYSIQSLDFVLMFIPIESAFSLAVQEKPEFFQEPFKKSIVVVSPTTLFIALRMIHSLWKMDRQNKNTENIVKLGKGLYNKFYGFLEDMDGIENRIKQTQESYTDAKKKLSSGKGSILSRMKKLKSFGIEPDKSIPKGFAHSSGVDEEDGELSNPLPESQELNEKTSELSPLDSHSELEENATKTMRSKKDDHLNSYSELEKNATKTDQNLKVNASNLHPEPEENIMDLKKKS